MTPTAGLALYWGLPFALLLLSIAVVPLVAADFWHAHYGKVSAFFALGYVVIAADGILRLVKTA